MWHHRGGRLGVQRPGALGGSVPFRKNPIPTAEVSFLGGAQEAAHTYRGSSLKNAPSPGQRHQRGQTILLLRHQRNINRKTMGTWGCPSESCSLPITSGDSAGL